MGMTKAWMMARDNALAEFLQFVCADLIAGDEDKARARMSTLDNHELRAAANVAKQIQDLVAAESCARMPPSPELEAMRALSQLPLEDALAECRKTIESNIEGKTILFNDQQQHASSFVGICRDDDPDKPYLAVTVHETRRFKEGQRAAKWYARTTRLNYRQIIEAIARAELIAKGVIAQKANKPSQ